MTDRERELTSPAEPSNLLDAMFDIMSESMQRIGDGDGDAEVRVYVRERFREERERTERLKAEAKERESDD